MKAFCTTTSSLDEKKKTFLSPSITTESQSPGGLSQHISLFFRSAPFWNPSINGGFGSNPPSFLPLRKMGCARKLGGNTENNQILEIVDVLYVKQHLQLQFHLSNDPSPGLVKAIELFDLVAVGVLKRLRTCTKIFLKPSCQACPSPQVILVEKGKNSKTNTPWKTNTEPKNEGLVPMIFLFTLGDL